MDKAKIKTTRNTRVMTLTGGVHHATEGESLTVSPDEAARLISSQDAESADKDTKK